MEKRTLEQKIENYGLILQERICAYKLQKEELKKRGEEQTELYYRLCGILSGLELALEQFNNTILKINYID